MTVIHHHPFDLTLAEFAAGTLDEGRALVVATHMSKCSQCRAVARSFERTRAVVMEDTDRAPMSPDALQRALQAVSSERPQRPIVQRGDADRSHLPFPLSAYPLGPWRRIWRHVHWRHVQVAPDGGTRVFMLKAAPSTKIPAHFHDGLEWTCILQGAFRHRLGHYGPGDFDEADETVEHDPVVEQGAECICLVAMQGHIRFKGWIGRVIQSFVRI
jgi:putative transcriptional regulator